MFSSNNFNPLASSDDKDDAPNAKAHNTNTDSTDDKAAKPKPKPKPMKWEAKKPAMTVTQYPLGSNAKDYAKDYPEMPMAKKEKKAEAAVKPAADDFSDESSDDSSDESSAAPKPGAVKPWADDFSDESSDDSQNPALSTKRKAEPDEEKKTKAPKMQKPVPAVQSGVAPKLAAPKPAAVKPAAPKPAAVKPAADDGSDESLDDSSNDGQGLALSTKREADPEEKLQKLVNEALKEPLAMLKDMLAKVVKLTTKVQELEAKSPDGMTEAGPTEERVGELIAAELKPITKKLEDVSQATKGSEIMCQSLQVNCNLNGQFLPAMRQATSHLEDKARAQESKSRALEDKSRAQGEMIQNLQHKLNRAEQVITFGYTTQDGVRYVGLKELNKRTDRAGASQYSPTRR